MKVEKGQFLHGLGYIVDLLLVILIVPAAYLLFVYRRFGSQRLKITTGILKKIGVFPVIDHYYEPLFNDSHLRQPLSDERALPGIVLDPLSQTEFLGKLTFRDELISFRDQWLKRSPKSDETSFWLANDSFVGGDAEFLYQFVRYAKPSKIVEIGSGHSTKVVRLATEKNTTESNDACLHICIEPYEQPWLEKLQGVEIRRERVEVSNFRFHEELDAGDLLFIDSSHIIRPQGDVLKEFLEIIPSLKPGVFVHVHDIFTPRDYLSSWIVENVLFWNEQYILEALLSNQERYEVVAALNFLKHNRYEELAAVCPYLTTSDEPGSFYFRVKD